MTDARVKRIRGDVRSATYGVDLKLTEVRRLRLDLEDAGDSPIFDQAAAQLVGAMQALVAANEHLTATVQLLKEPADG